MRSLRGLLAACAFLSIIPLALVASLLFDVEAEITVHFVAAVGFALLALAVFDFEAPVWLTWAACVAATVSAATYLLQGLSNLAPNNEAIQYVAFQVLGHGVLNIERRDKRERAQDCVGDFHSWDRRARGSRTRRPGR